MEDMIVWIDLLKQENVANNISTIEIYNHFDNIILRISPNRIMEEYYYLYNNNYFGRFADLMNVTLKIFSLSILNLYKDI